MSRYFQALDSVQAEREIQLTVTTEIVINCVARSSRETTPNEQFNRNNYSRIFLLKSYLTQMLHSPFIIILYTCLDDTERERG